MCRPNLCYFLLLIVAALARHSRATETQGQCIYPNRENVTHPIVHEPQSREINCFSTHMHGPVYHHVREPTQSEESSMPWAIVQCEASSTTMRSLKLHRDADKTGLYNETMKGRCVSSALSVGESPDVNCTVVMVYINMTYYDQHNDSTIPICGLSGDNSECFCITYILDDISDSERECATTTTNAASTTTTSTTTTSTTSASTTTANEQPSIDAQGTRKLAEAFRGVVPVLAVVIAALLVIIAILVVIIVKSKMKSNSVSSRPTGAFDQSGETPVEFTPIPQSTQKKAKITSGDATMKCGHNHPHPDGTSSDDEHDHDHFPFEETHGLLLRSKSLPVPTGSYHD